MSDQTEISEQEYLRNVLEEAMSIICDALGVDTDRYDSDQSDDECYMDCFRDAADVIKVSGIRWDHEGGEFKSRILPCIGHNEATK